MNWSRALVLACALIACRDKQPRREPPKIGPITAPQYVEGREAMVAFGSVVAVATTNGEPDPALLKLRDEYIADAMEYTGLSKEQVLAKIHGAPMKEEWEAWEKAGPMTDERIKQFYKQTRAYIFDLAGWHLYDALKWQSDVALANSVKDGRMKNVLDFGGGVGFNSFPIAQLGVDVTLADLDSETLKFAEFRAKKRGVKLKFWRTDTEPMPPDAKYDGIIVLDVLEHLPEKELINAVDKLVKLKHAGTKLVVHAPFGKTATHPMHLDASPEMLRQVERLNTAVGK